MRVAIAALAVAALAGCGGGPFPEQEKEVKVEMVRHFAELNAEAGLRAQEAKAARMDIDIAPTALVLNQYAWDLEGSVYPNVTCHACQAKLGTLATAVKEIRCPACNTDLKEELGRVGRAQPMFEIKSGNSLPIVVVVRYLRHSLAYDPSSAVMVSSKTEAMPEHSIKSYTDVANRSQGSVYYAGGFYRVAGTALCTTAFVYKGGELHQVDPESVKKMTAESPENVPVSQMKLGRWGAVEVPRTPWLGKPPMEGAAAPKETPKETPTEKPKSE